MPPFISIITITFNNLNELKKTFCSVASQSYPNIEYIIIDGGSTDGTKEFLTKNKKNLAAAISEPDEGIYNAMNKGIDLATGTWIIFMNAGDRFYSPEVLDNIFSSSSFDLQMATLLYGDNIYERGKIQKYRKACKVELLSQHMIACHQSMFMKREYLQLMKFNEIYNIISDYILTYSLYREKGKKSFLYLNQPISITASGGASDSTKGRLAVWYEILKFQKSLYFPHGKRIIPFCMYKMAIELIKTPIRSVFYRVFS
jgi:glycosyltransferase involved in cell wall biosynthesis